MVESESIYQSHKKRLVLLVEDNPLQANGIRSIVEATGIWNVEVCHTDKEAISALEKKFEEKKGFPEVIFIDLGLPPLPNDTKTGLALLNDIYNRWKGIRLVMHTSLTGAMDEYVVHEIISKGVSLIYLRDYKETTDFSSLLTFIAEGYIVFSPKPASILPNIVSTRPDPLMGKKNLWETLGLLAQENKTYEEIADILYIEPRSVMNRVKQIATLIGVDEINLLADESDQENERYKKKVIRWWRQNHNRYGH